MRTRRCLARHDGALPMQYVVWQSCEKHKCLESGPREHSIVSCPLSGHRRLLETNSPGRRLASVRAYLLVFFLEVLVLLVAGTVDVGSRTTSYYALYIILNHRSIKLWGSEDVFGRSSLTCRPHAIGRTSVRPKVKSLPTSHASG